MMTQRSTTTKNNSGVNVRWSFLRILLIDLPLLATFTAYIAALTLELVHLEYLKPLKDLFEWNDQRRDVEVTFYHYQCTDDDISADSADELVITQDMSTQQAIDHMQIHGATMVPNILSNTTADALRAFIVEENLRQEGWFVISNKNRYSFGIQVDQHPSIPLALHEIAQHEVLRPMLDQLVGRNPAVIEFTAITSTYGASMQNYHEDVVPEGSAAKYARSFIPSYSLFIPLQDTTAAMGATDLCPGTQLCGGGTTEDVCLEYGISAAGTQDKWPKGWGALVNQQTMHRGTAHKDRHGADRVVFILTFAPRPQYSLPGVVESRLLGQSGSYSIHWTQFGHTLDDFGAAQKQMTEPFRTLRSLGIYKPASADWGWDLVTVALMRMANGDNGYTRDSLEDFVEKGGFSWLPRWLQAPLTDWDEDDGPLDGGWHDFLVGTFDRVKEALRLLNQYTAMTFVVGICTASLWTTFVHKSPLAGVRVLIQNTYRVAFTHGLVFALAWLYFTKLSKTYWAQNIENGKLFRPFRHAAVSTQYEFDVLKEYAFTLPNKRDVLVAPHYRSKYLASYANILDYNQRGNLIWAELVWEHSMGYRGLTPALKANLCEFLVHDIMFRTYRGRMLYQPEAGRWKALAKDDAVVICHEALMKDGNPLVGALHAEIDYLETETEFGAWRNMAIHRTTIPDYLNDWSNRLLGLASKANNKAAAFGSPQPTVYFGKREALSVGNTIPPAAMEPSRIPSQPPTDPRPPFHSAWLTTGDIVEGMYRGEHDGKGWCTQYFDIKCHCFLTEVFAI